MVKNKKALILLLLFLVFFNSPVYPKDKSIKYLPSSQDVETVSKDYPGLKKGEIDCPPCASLSNLSHACDNCVKLNNACPDDCLTTNSPDPRKVIKCTKEDDLAYNCTNAPFVIADCPQTECGYVDSDSSTNCSSRSKDASTDCLSSEYLKCNGVSVDSTTSPYGRQRRGCPDADSDELAPSGCSGCTVSGTGKDRVWTCPKTSTCTLSSSPSFQTCSESSGPPRCDGLGSYYDVTYVWDSTTSCTTTQSCNNQCNPTCTPATPPCSSTSLSCADTTCPATQNCPIPCTPPCWDQLVCPPPPPCFNGICPPPPPCFKVKVCGTCTPTPCTATATCTTTPYIKSYVYSLNSTFKSCIDTCITYADDYEECQDRVECCTRELCGTESNGDCCTSPESRCDERSTASSACYNSTEGDCTRLNQAAQQCLEGAAGVCFNEIDSDTYYDFTARTGEAYNVIWQINTEPLAEAKNDENAKFYTMIKVVEPSGAIVYSSMLHQKSLNAAFSIYGNALIPKGTLQPGKYYKIQVHYFMNDNVDDTSTSENEDTNYEVEIKHMSLTVIRVRE